MAASSHGKVIFTSSAQYLKRGGRLTLTESCLLWTVKEFNYPRRVRDLHLPLTEVESVHLDRGANAIRVQTKRGSSLYFLVYQVVPILFIPVWDELAREWFAAIRRILDAPIVPCPLGMDAPRTGPNPHAKIFKLWFAVAIAMVVVSVLLGLSWPWVVAIVGLSALPFMFAAGFIPSG